MSKTLESRLHDHLFAAGRERSLGFQILVKKAVEQKMSQDEWVAAYKLLPKTTKQKNQGRLRNPHRAKRAWSFLQKIGAFD